MNLSNANDILNELVKCGKLTEAEVIEMVKRNPMPETKRIVDLIHGVFCAAEHSVEGHEYACNYYLEENDLKPWEMTEHQVWVELTIDMMNQLDIQSENEFLNCFRAAKRVKEEIQSLTPQAQDLLQRLLKIP